MSLFRLRTGSLGRWRGWMGLLVALCACLASNPAYAGRLEAGSFSAHRTGLDPNPATITFQQPFDTIPVVVVLPNQAGNAAATVRITNVTTTGFDELVLEPDSYNGPHNAMETHYIAIEPGRHVLPDGRIIETGHMNTSAVQHGTGVAGPTSWDTVTFSAGFPAAASVIAQIQTANSETQNVASQASRPFITAAVSGVSATSFQLALERSQAHLGPIPSTETIGWIALPAGSSGSFLDVSGNTIAWSAVNTSANIQGWSDGCVTNAHGQTSTTTIAVATKNTRNGGDGGWLRRCSLSSTLVGLTVDEDTSLDSERSHLTTESASIIAFSRAFHANLRAELGVTKLNFATTSPISDFNIPGATVDYLITVTNTGSAPPNYDSVVVTERLPAELALVVSDFAGPGSGPILYTDGSPATGLNCLFVSLASTTDCYSFSTDGVNFNYTPTDSGDGTDPAVTHVRIVPTGYMAGDTGSGPPSFQLRLRAMIE